MANRKVLKRIFESVNIPVEGDELAGGIIGSEYKYYRFSGLVQQVIIELVSGAATSIDVEIRYISGDSSLSNLIYKYTGGTLDFIDSSISAQFALGGGGTVYDDIYLYINPDAAGIFDIRVDLEIDM